MYATVFKPDPLDPARGAKYRKAILQPGGSREEDESLKVTCLCLHPTVSSGIDMTCLQEFLGRRPNSEAFVRELFGHTGSNL